MKYTTDVPTIPGYYWERQKGGRRIIQFPYCGQWPIHWIERKKDSIECNEGDNVMIKKLKSLPDSAWFVEWAGPIPEPEN